MTLNPLEPADARDWGGLRHVAPNGQTRILMTSIEGVPAAEFAALYHWRCASRKGSSA